MQMAFKKTGVLLMLCVLVAVVNAKKDVNCKNGETFPHEKDCRKYYVCDHGMNVTMQCPLGTAWHKDNVTCVHTEDVGCKFHIPKAKSGSGNFTCPAKFGNYPNPKDCTKFYVCTWGRVEIKQCPPSTGWDPKLQYCNFKDKLPGCK
ncbi:peritrophin-1-like [Ostrea edulis]|uniref:peritrophin-1-like n=1 Tax=Ostrea edulis TaxID=37623 RepID=UPI0024AF3A7A|nr:peritrophin-1-like [Ostrea edulis]